MSNELRTVAFEHSRRHGSGLSFTEPPTINDADREFPAPRPLVYRSDAEARITALELALMSVISAYDRHQNNMVEGLGVVSGGRMRDAIDSARAAIKSEAP